MKMQKIYVQLPDVNFTQVWPITSKKWDTSKIRVLVLLFLIFNEYDLINSLIPF